MRYGTWLTTFTDWNRRYQHLCVYVAVTVGNRQNVICLVGRRRFWADDLLEVDVVCSSSQTQNAEQCEDDSKKHKNNKHCKTTENSVAEIAAGSNLNSKEFLTFCNLRVAET